MKNQQRLIIDKFRKSFSSLSLLKPSKKQKNTISKRVPKKNNNRVQFFPLNAQALSRKNKNLLLHPDSIIKLV